MKILPELTEYIRSKNVVDFEEIKSRFPNRSESSIRRDLSKLKCVTSYTDNSKYYTLPDIPDYDDFGLWQYGTTRFSRHGTIKETARILIDGSTCGLSHTELSNILGVPLYNSLRALVKEGSVVCETDGHKMTFYSGDVGIGKQQRSNSRGFACNPADHPFDLHITIDLLLAVFLENEDTVDKAYIYLKANKHPDISRKEVEEIFDFYKLTKKN